MKKSLNIVPVDQIPIGEAPPDNLLEIFRTITQMEKLCTDLSGVGLSAVQVGIPWNVFIVLRDDHYEYYVNCDYEGFGKKEKSIEGCLSLRNKDGGLRRFEVDRHPAVRIKGKQLKIGDSPSLVLEDVNRMEEELMAIVFQHEIDHQRGVLISHIGKEVEIY